MRRTIATLATLASRPHGTELEPSAAWQDGYQLETLVTSSLPLNLDSPFPVRTLAPSECRRRSSISQLDL